MVLGTVRAQSRELSLDDRFPIPNFGPITAVRPPQRSLQPSIAPVSGPLGAGPIRRNRPVTTTLVKPVEIENEVVSEQIASVEPQNLSFIFIDEGNIPTQFIDPAITNNRSTTFAPQTTVFAAPIVTTVSPTVVEQEQPRTAIRTYKNTRTPEFLFRPKLEVIRREPEIVSLQSTPQRPVLSPQPAAFISQPDLIIRTDSELRAFDADHNAYIVDEERIEPSANGVAGFRYQTSNGIHVQEQSQPDEDGFNTVTGSYRLVQQSQPDEDGFNIVTGSYRLVLCEKDRVSSKPIFTNKMHCIIYDSTGSYLI